LDTLRFFDVSFNRLTELPLSLSQLTGLCALNLAFNPLGRESAGLFPDAIFGLKSLKELNMDFTGCFVIDQKFGKLNSLEALQVCACLLLHE
jgi:Leucine-rich repeat (LRR) protein